MRTVGGEKMRICLDALVYTVELFLLVLSDELSLSSARALNSSTFIHAYLHIYLLLRVITERLKFTFRMETEIIWANVIKYFSLSVLLDPSPTIVMKKYGSWPQRIWVQSRDEDPVGSVDFCLTPGSTIGTNSYSHSYFPPVALKCIYIWILLLYAVM